MLEEPARPRKAFSGRARSPPPARLTQAMNGVHFSTLDQPPVPCPAEHRRNSINLINAVEYANNNGATTVGITSFDGGQLCQMAKLGVHVSANKGEYGPAEDAHMVLNHLIGAYLTRWVADEK